MKLSVFILGLWSLMGARMGLAVDDGPLLDGCFDYDQPKLERPAGAPDLKLPASGVEEAKGQTSRHKVDWAALRTRIDKPIKAVWEMVRDHRIGKNMCITHMESSFEKKKGFIDVERLVLSVNVWAFITIDWTEGWAYQLLSGTVARPKGLRAYYQKLKGSGHLRHLCGFIELHEINPKQTDIYFYEQVKATKVDAAATLGKHREAVRKLRGEVPLGCAEEGKKEDK